MKRLLIVAVAFAAALANVTPISAQWAATCGRKLEITIRNETQYTYKVKLNGVDVRTVKPGKHIHVIHPHGQFRLDAVPTEGGPGFSQWLESHNDLIWLLQIPDPPATEKPKPVPGRNYPNGATPSKKAGAQKDFYTQFEHAGRIAIKAPACVRPQALREAKRLVDRMFKRAPELRKRLENQGLEIVIFGASQKLTDLPETAHLKGKLDSDGDLYDELQGMSCLNRAFVSEKNLLGAPGDKFRDESVLVHELGHLVMRAGIDETDQPKIFGTYLAAMLKDLWEDRYASANPAEYFSELTQSFFTVNDPKDHNGAEQLKDYDPAGFALVAAVYSDQPLPEPKGLFSRAEVPADMEDETPTAALNQVFSGLKGMLDAIDRLLELLRTLEEEK